MGVYFSFIALKLISIMKKITFLLLCLIAVIQSYSTDYKLYLWLKYPKGMNYAYGLEIAVNGTRMGSIKTKELAIIHLKGEKKYFIEIFDQGRSISSEQISNLTDSISYYQLTVAVKGFTPLISLDVQDKVSGGLYVMQSSNYTKKLDFYEQGIDESANGPAYGSGFLISSDGYIVTNYHVIEGYKKFTVKGIDGDYSTEYSADVVTKDVSNDLVILQLKNKTVKFSDPPFTIRQQGASTGEDIFILGYPLGPILGDEIKLTTGVISAKSGIDGNVSAYQISAAAQPGNSGGPLFDNQGNIIGVVNAKIMKAENITYAIKAIYLQALLSMLPSEPHLPTTNTLKDISLAQKVSQVSKYIYIIKSE